MSLDTGLEFVSDHVIRIIKSEVAQKLYEAGYTQLGISRVLGVTQPMVNKILSSREETRRKAIEEGLDLSDIDSIANVVASLVLSNKSQAALEYLINKLMLNLSHLDYCESHRRINPKIPIDCRVCGLLLNPRDMVIRNLVAAVNEIESSPQFTKLIPRVLMNIAEAVPDPRNEMDIAAVPGRIGIERGMPKAWGLPSYGVSTHLGRILLGVAHARPKIRAVASIKHDSEIENALKLSRLKYSVLSHESAPTEDEIIELVARSASLGDLDAVIDLGGFGIEPITYIFGMDSLQVIHKLRNILDHMQ
ncbi:MAG: thiamine-phosphate synthase family protein [Thermocladium sp.]